ncbi:MAG TPA: hypothetical protein VF829_00715 [Candidatus Paceibacterota bacterium]
MLDRTCQGLAKIYKPFMKVIAEDWNSLAERKRSEEAAVTNLRREMSFLACGCGSETDLIFSATAVVAYSARLDFDDLEEIEGWMERYEDCPEVQHRLAAVLILRGRPSAYAVSMMLECQRKIGSAISEFAEELLAATVH